MGERVVRTLAAALAAALTPASWTLRARADGDADAPDISDLPITSEGTAPPPSSARYLQYGVGFTGELVGPLSSAGPMCDAAQPPPSAPGEPSSGAPCILGSGGGVAIRIGWRAAGPWYFGGAYELSKQDPNKLYRLAILHQLRGEARYYFRPELQTQPFLTGGAGVAGYGDEFDPRDTFGPLAFLGAGFETQISRRSVFVFDVAYRALLFSRFTDTSGAVRPSGVATMLGFDLAVEARDPL